MAENKTTALAIGIMKMSAQQMYSILTIHFL